MQFENKWTVKNFCQHPSCLLVSTCSWDYKHCGWSGRFYSPVIIYIYLLLKIKIKLFRILPLSDCFWSPDVRFYSPVIYWISMYLIPVKPVFFFFNITLVGLMFGVMISCFFRVSELIETLARYQKEGRPDTRPGSQLPTIVVEKLPLDSLDSDVLLGRFNFHLSSATRT